jgi:hypothetical protein
VSCVGIGTGSRAEAERAVRLFPHIDLGGRPGAAHRMGGAAGAGRLRHWACLLGHAGTGAAQSDRLTWA